MKQKLGLCLVGCLIVLAVGAGTLAGQETSTFEKRVAPPQAPSPPEAPDVVEYWNNDDEDAPPPPEMLEGDAATAHVVPFPHQRIERDRIFIRGDAGPWLGIMLSDINAAKAKELKLTGENGVWVKDVREDSSAAKAGILKDDVIVEYAGEKVRSAAQLRRLVHETAPDRSVPLVVSRAGQTKTLTAKIEPHPESAFA
ncbi:MAG: PDZ domain-containing protein, partial [Terriglobia bacterium]